MPDEQRKRAERDVGQEKSAADKAAAAREEIRAQIEAADRTIADTGVRVERARRVLEDALEAQSEAQKAQRSTHAAFDRADRSAKAALQRFADATERLDRSRQ